MKTTDNIAKYGERFKEIRLESKLTQQEFANTLGFKIDYIRGIEQGRYNTISMKVLLALYEKYDISPNYLVLGIQPKLLNERNETIEVIKKQNPKTPIIVQTAYSTQAKKKKAREIGCNAFISKPITESVLNELLNVFLRES